MESSSLIPVLSVRAARKCRYTALVVWSVWCGVIAGVAWAWPIPFANALVPWPNDQPHVVPTTAGVAEFDLPFQAGEQYVLVVSDLGTDLHPHPVQMTAQSIATAQAHPRSLSRWPSLPLVASPLEAPDETLAAVDPFTESATATYDQSTARREFWIHVGEAELEDQRAYVKIETQRVATGRRVEIWRDTAIPAGTVGTELTDTILRELESAVLPLIEHRFGRLLDLDHDGKLAVCLTPWLGRLQGGRTSVRGFVRSSDFRDDLEAPFSNHAEILYLNSELPTGAALRTLLLHETAHAAIFSRRFAAQPQGRSFSALPDWWNEGLAHLTEQAGRGDWSNLDTRISRAQADPAGSPLIVDDYYRTGKWRDPGARGAAYLFLQWCERRFGQEWLDRTLTIPHFQPRLTGELNGLPCAELFRQWSIDRWLNTASVNQYGEHLVSRPAIQAWNVQQRKQQFEIVGGATSYWNLAATGQTGWQRIRITNPRQTPLQVTVWRTAAQPCPVQIHGDWATNDTPDAVDNHATGFTVRLSLPRGWDCSELQLEAVTGDQPRLLKLDAQQMQSLVQQAAAGSSEVTLNWPLHWQAGDESRRWVLKALVRDPRDEARLIMGAVAPLPLTTVLARGPQPTVR